MPKRNRNSSQRGHNTTANGTLLRQPVVLTGDASYVQALRDMRAWEDRRTFRPDPYNARTFGRVGHLLQAPPAKKSPRTGKLQAFTRIGVNFVQPSRVFVCIRRKIRKEVMFALKKTGKGAGARRRRNQFSDIGC